MVDTLNCTVWAFWRVGQVYMEGLWRVLEIYHEKQWNVPVRRDHHRERYRRGILCSAAKSTFALKWFASGRGMVLLTMGMYTFACVRCVARHHCASTFWAQPVVAIKNPTFGQPSRYIWCTLCGDKRCWMYRVMYSCEAGTRPHDVWCTTDNSLLKHYIPSTSIQSKSTFWLM